MYDAFSEIHKLSTGSFFSISGGFESVIEKSGVLKKKTDIEKSQVLKKVR